MASRRCSASARAESTRSTVAGLNIGFLPTIRNGMRPASASDFSHRAGSPVRAESDDRVTKGLSSMPAKIRAHSVRYPYQKRTLLMVSRSFVWSRLDTHVFYLTHLPKCASMSGRKYFFSVRGCFRVLNLSGSLATAVRTALALMMV